MFHIHPWSTHTTPAHIRTQQSAMFRALTMRAHTHREDAVGNIFGRWPGSAAGLGSVLTGSHCDAIPLAGMYDGTLGVIGAIEALAALKRAVRQCCFSLCMLNAVFSSVDW